MNGQEAPAFAEEHREEEFGTEERKAESTGLSEEDFSALLESVSAMAPLVKGLFGHHGGGGKNPACGRREALLLALKPYLSPARCAAVDYLIRIGRIGDTLRALY